LCLYYLKKLCVIFDSSRYTDIYCIGEGNAENSRLTRYYEPVQCGRYYEVLGVSVELNCCCTAPRSEILSLHNASLLKLDILVRAVDRVVLSTASW
jgi:hypothetical protein